MGCLLSLSNPGSRLGWRTPVHEVFLGPNWRRQDTFADYGRLQ